MDLFIHSGVHLKTLVGSWRRAGRQEPAHGQWAGAGEDKGGKHTSRVTSDGGRGQGHSTVVTGCQGKGAIGNFHEKAMGELEPSARKEPAKGRAGEGCSTQGMTRAKALRWGGWSDRNCDDRATWGRCAERWAGPGGQPGFMWRAMGSYRETQEQS